MSKKMLHVNILVQACALANHSIWMGWLNATYVNAKHVIATHKNGKVWMGPYNKPHLHLKKKKKRQLKKVTVYVKYQLTASSSVNYYSLPSPTSSRLLYDLIIFLPAVSNTHSVNNWGRSTTCDFRESQHLRPRDNGAVINWEHKHLCRHLGTWRFFLYQYIAGQSVSLWSRDLLFTGG